jgi:hypothetical protein
VGEKELDIKKGKDKKGIVASYSCAKR